MNKKKVRNILLTIISILVLVGLGLFYILIYPKLPIATGYAAKKMCSCTFIDGRNQEVIQNEDLGFSPLNLTKTSIDKDSKTVQSSIYGLAKRTAEYRDGLGCVLLNGKDDHHVSYSRKSAGPKKDIIVSKTTSLNVSELDKAIDNAFDPEGELTSKKTRAVVVYHRDTLVAERYAQGFTADSKILGWSMTKSIMNALIGIMVKNGDIDIREKNLFPQWTDERADISLHDLLQMQSGLEFVEDYAEVSDVTKMLYLCDDIVEVASDVPLVHEPGSHWYYSSGTSNLISGIIRKKIDSDRSYWSFPYDSLFSRIGMTTAVMETDEAGNYIGSSYCYATPRDWGKFGLLYLNNGFMNGDSILSKSWIDYTREAASASEGDYGAHFWQNHNHSAYPDVPSDMYSCNGFQGQYVFIIPSYDLVVVRMGLSERFDVNTFLKNILSSFQKS